MAEVSLREIVKPELRGNIARFARAVGVSWTSGWRWTLPADHPDHVVPLPCKWEAIEQATGGLWTAPRAAFGGKALRRRRPNHVNAAASRKAAATLRRQREARS